MNHTADRPCPRCGARLLHVERRDNTLEICSSCRGTFLDPGELTVLVEVYRELKALESKEAGVTCLRCESAMRALTYPGTEVSIARCPSCESIWLDEDTQLEQLRAQLAHLIPPEDERHREAVLVLEDLYTAGRRRFCCPRCGPEAELSHEKRGSNLVEACPQCDGLWFDPGELTLEVEVYRELEPETGQDSALRCLVCDEVLRELPFPGTDVPIACCPQCRGVWLDRADLARIKGAFSDVVPQAPGSLQDRARELAADLAPSHPREGEECPICQGALDHEKRAGVVLDVCTDCGGTWFDSGELTIVLGVSRKIRLKGAEATDLACVRCPGEKLVELPYPGTEIKIDVCKDCRGAWLDEGELERLVETLGGERTG